jgi:putative MFS transporter
MNIKNEELLQNEIYDDVNKSFDSNLNSNISKIDEYLDRVGYSRFHIISILIVCFVFFVDGCEMIIINLILSSLGKDWKLGLVQRSLLSSAVFFGFFSGSLFSGYFTNKYGRRNPSIIGAILIWSFTSCTPLCNSFESLFCIRIFVGLGIGIIVPATTTIITESIPSYYRSFALNNLWTLYPLGIIYICKISSYFIVNEEFLDWRKITFINGYTSIIILFLVVQLRESPRYLLIKGRYDEAYDVLNSIGKSKNIKLSENEKILLKNQAIELNGKINKNNDDFNIGLFFESKFLLTTLLVGYLWLISSFITYGLLYMLPKIFDNLSHDKLDSLNHMIVAMSILFPCPCFRGIISEIKFLGRKNSMMYGFIGATITCLCLILSTEHVSLFAGFLKFFTSISIGIISVYTSEIYPTNIRSISLGLGNSITRVAGILIPFICEIIEMYFHHGSFLFFIFCSITGVLACYALPYETLDVALDTIVQKNSFSKSEENENFIKIK